MSMDRFHQELEPRLPCTNRTGAPAPDAAKNIDRPSTASALPLMLPSPAALLGVLAARRLEKQLVLVDAARHARPGEGFHQLVHVSRRILHYFGALEVFLPV